MPTLMLSCLADPKTLVLNRTATGKADRPKTGKDTVTFRLLPETKELLTKAAESSGLDKSK